MYRLLKKITGRNDFQTIEIGEYPTPNKVVEALRIQKANNLDPHHFLVQYWGGENFESEMDYEINAHDWLYRLGISERLM